MKNNLSKFVSIFTAFIMIFGTSLFFPHVSAFADDNNANLVSNGDFESGTIDGWIKQGNPTLAATTEEAIGQYSMKVAGRTQTYEGPAYSFLGKMQKGQSYNVSLKVRLVSGQNSSNPLITVTMFREDDNGKHYDTIVWQKQVSEDSWTTVNGTYTLDYTGTLKTLYMYVESPDPTLEYYIDDVVVTPQNPIQVGEISNNQITIQNDIPDLYSVFKDYFPIGVAVDPSRLNDTDPHAQLTAKHFNMLVAENAMKPESLQPTEGNFTFDNADKIVNYAIAHNMKMRGHTLLWHNQVPDWFFQDPNDPTKPASRDLLLQRLKTHIATVLDHFKTKYGAQNPIIGWDVVNEVLDDNGNLRNSKWLQIIGPDYIEKAFEYAHEADPSMKLFINDYNIENNGVKTQAMYDLVKKLKSEGVPINGIGMQMHININSNIDNIKASIEKLASLGVEIQVTELDMNMNGNISNEALLKQARLYKQLFDLFKAEKPYITAVVFWGVSDDVTWLSKPNAPLLFDSKLQAKPAFWAIVDPSKAIPDIQSAKALEGSPTIGENVDNSWKLVKPLYANTYVEGTVGATATVKSMWDTKNLYLLVQVSDNTPSSNDGIEIFVDKNDNKSTSYETDDEHYTIKRDGTGSSDITKYVTSNADGYIAQLAIPIEDINPALNNKIGFDIRINDDKGNGNIDAITVWNDYTNSQDTNTSYFGDIVLSKPAQIATAIYGTPVIDGKIDDIWNNVGGISTNTWVLGSNGATATAKMMWDDKYLYVLAVVTDENLNKSSVNPYEQDSVEVFVDQNNDKTSYYESDDGQYRVNYDNEQSFGGSTNSNGFMSATSITQNGYIVEEAIPFTAIIPSNSTIIGFDLQVNDANENGQRTGIVTWCDPSGNSWQDTSGFGNLLLTGKPSGDTSSNNNINSSINNTIGIVTKNGNVITLTLDAGKAKDLINNTKDKNVVFDLTTLGTSQQKIVEISKDILTASAASDKDIVIKSDNASIVLSEDTLDPSQIASGVNISIKDNGKPNASNYVPLSNMIDISIKSDSGNVVLVKPVEVTLNISKANDPRKVAVYYYNPTTSQWEYVGGKVDALSGTITFNATHFSQYAAFEYDKTFNDIKDNWAKDVIEVLASRHIVEGMTDTQYEPSKTVTRAEFTAMILRLLNIKEEAYSGEFSDVKSGDWYANAIEAAYKAGIIEGDGKNMRPNDSITREEMTAIAMRAYEMLTSYKEENIGATSFNDDKSISDWAKNVVANATKLGIVNGEPNNVFAPKGIATRAEAAAIVYGLLEKSNNL
ncbi:Cellulose 1,4-beta-cellobiosidase [Thermoanaerobacterium thermosaccharolyticum DSM 571]|uniref:Beta-xylanase n=1 Tax=Thermoanaerobacterium thermosaccharolyticum (strain ATCC 7956 / DSM 571 / NCIMB 9385 / NCA 3814 / NCTC 13789 / WDCM 00135 / 2032) TaxID=580327 RepID=D9TMZ9_THETC|nr:endo-1,4-beta-xylanase [Thermoanaerobacterium thermosaccharolyticum]ADL68522.1 Cellulose 1,4-beta-cellobiosidase [Thermoanaerobacterium thermosaccharolyticum DSM 571]